MEQIVRTAIASGIPPDEVAEQVLQAVVHERFWILTHPKTKKADRGPDARHPRRRHPQFDPRPL